MKRGHEGATLLDERTEGPDILMGAEVLMELKCRWRQGIGKVEDDGQRGIVEIGKWEQLYFSRSHNIMLQNWDSNQVSLLRSPASTSAVH